MSAALFVHSSYHIMLDCWNTEPKERPHFSDLVHKLGDQLEANVKQVTFTNAMARILDG